ncbi:dipeptide ABC transporter ATP-binding protein [Okibacterium endophyticum]
MSEPLLKVMGLSVDYGRGRSLHRAVDDVTFEVRAGETVGLIGESGSGKSSIGRAIVGLAPAAAGSILLDGQDIRHLAGRERRRVAAQVQVVFQDPYGSLNPALTVGEILREPLRVAGINRLEQEDRITGLLRRVGLAPETVRLYPAQFSGGQRQRIAIARALVTRPKIVVCDEATSALDLTVQAQVLELLSSLQAEYGLSYLFIGHNIDVMRSLARRVVVLNKGRVVEQGDVGRILREPSDPYTKRLLAATLSPDPKVQEMRRLARRAEGAPPADVSAHR